jgi:hypothetical protein
LIILYIFDLDGMANQPISADARKWQRHVDLAIYAWIITTKKTIGRK